MVGWFLQVMLLKVSLLSLGGGEAPLLDLIAYAGYSFSGLCVAIAARITLSYAYYFIVLWISLCVGTFLVKTMKRALFAEVRSYDSSRHHYLLLSIAVAQFPLIFWLSNITGNWFFWWYIKVVEHTFCLTLAIEFLIEGQLFVIPNESFPCIKNLKLIIWLSTLHDFIFRYPIPFLVSLIFYNYSKKKKQKTYHFLAIKSSKGCANFLVWSYKVN